MIQALSSLSGRRSPGGGRSPGRYQALPRSLQRKKPESLPPPQLHLAPAPGEGTRFALCFLDRKRERRSARPHPQLTVRRVQGRDCSLEVAGHCCRRRAQAAGAHSPRLRRDWLARADQHQLSCQPRVSGGGAPCSLGPAQVTRRGTHTASGLHCLPHWLGRTVPAEVAFSDAHHTLCPTLIPMRVKPPSCWGAPWRGGPPVSPSHLPTGNLGASDGV